MLSFGNMCRNHLQKGLELTCNEVYAEQLLKFFLSYMAEFVIICQFVSLRFTVLYAVNCPLL